MADAAKHMALRGYRVVVLTSRRGYEDPHLRYKPREVIDGVEVVRLPASSFGKGSLAARLIGAAAFLCQAVIRGALLRRLSGVLVSTSPPMCSIAGVAISAVRRVPMTYWLMDLNPDQAVALGSFHPHALVVRALHVLNWLAWRRARSIIALDRFMASRIRTRVRDPSKIVVIPPWPQDDHLQPVPHDTNPFRTAHSLTGRFVVLYSGNHTPSNPLSTLLAAAARLRARSDIAFLFIGGGAGKHAVDTAARNTPNIISLPYQPHNAIKYSLAAGDLHVVSLGDALVGVIHPSKVYSALAVGKPILFLGPPNSHVGDILRQYPLGFAVRHGDTEGLVRAITTAAAATPSTVAAYEASARSLLDTEFSRSRLCQHFASVLEHGPRTSPELTP